MSTVRTIAIPAALLALSACAVPAGPTRPGTGDAEALSREMLTVCEQSVGYQVPRPPGTFALPVAGATPDPDAARVCAHPAAYAYEWTNLDWLRGMLP